MSATVQHDRLSVSGVGPSSSHAATGTVSYASNLGGHPHTHLLISGAAAVWQHQQMLRLGPDRLVMARIDPVDDVRDEGAICLQIGKVAGVADRAGDTAGPAGRTDRAARHTAAGLGELNHLSGQKFPFMNLNKYKMLKMG